MLANPVECLQRNCVAHTFSSPVVAPVVGLPSVEVPFDDCVVFFAEQGRPLVTDLSLLAGAQRRGGASVHAQWISVDNRVFLRATVTDGATTPGLVSLPACLGNVNSVAVGCFAEGRLEVAVATTASIETITLSLDGDRCVVIDQKLLAQRGAGFVEFVDKGRLVAVALDEVAVFTVRNDEDESASRGAGATRSAWRSWSSLAASLLGSAKAEFVAASYDRMRRHCFVLTTHGLEWWSVAGSPKRQAFAPSAKGAVTVQVSFHDDEHLATVVFRDGARRLYKSGPVSEGGHSNLVVALDVRHEAMSVSLHDVGISAIAPDAVAVVDRAQRLFVLEASSIPFLEPTVPRRCHVVTTLRLTEEPVGLSVLPGDGTHSCAAFVVLGRRGPLVTVFRRPFHDVLRRSVDACRSLSDSTALVERCVDVVGGEPTCRALLKSYRAHGALEEADRSIAGLLNALMLPTLRSMQEAKLSSVVAAVRTVALEFLATVTFLLRDGAAADLESCRALESQAAAIRLWLAKIAETIRGDGWLDTANARHLTHTFKWTDDLVVRCDDAMTLSKATSAQALFLATVLCGMEFLAIVAALYARAFRVRALIPPMRQPLHPIVWVESQQTSELLRVGVAYVESAEAFDDCLVQLLPGPIRVLSAAAASTTVDECVAFLVTGAAALCGAELMPTALRLLRRKLAHFGASVPVSLSSMLSVLAAWSRASCNVEEVRGVVEPLAVDELEQCRDMDAVRRVIPLLQSFSRPAAFLEWATTRALADSRREVLVDVVAALAASPSADVERVILSSAVGMALYALALLRVSPHDAAARSILNDAAAHGDLSLNDRRLAFQCLLDDDPGDKAAELSIGLLDVQLTLCQASGAALQAPVADAATLFSHANDAGAPDTALRIWLLAHSHNQELEGVDIATLLDQCVAQSMEQQNELPAGAVLRVLREFWPRIPEGSVGESRAEWASRNLFGTDLSGAATVCQAGCVDAKSFFTVLLSYLQGPQGLLGVHPGATLGKLLTSLCDVVMCYMSGDTQLLCLEQLAWCLQELTSSTPPEQLRAMGDMPAAVKALRSLSETFPQTAPYTQPVVAALEGITT